MWHICKDYDSVVGLLLDKVHNLNRLYGMTVTSFCRQVLITAAMLEVHLFQQCTCRKLAHASKLVCFELNTSRNARSECSHFPIQLCLYVHIIFPTWRRVTTMTISCASCIYMSLMTWHAAIADLREREPVCTVRWLSDRSCTLYRWWEPSTREEQSPKTASLWDARCCGRWLPTTADYLQHNAMLIIAK